MLTKSELLSILEDVQDDAEVEIRTTTGAIFPIDGVDVRMSTTAGEKPGDARKIIQKVMIY